jgi:nicotinamidase-related amidase
MRNYLIVVDMQNDFIDGALGTAEAVAIVDRVAEKIRGFDGEVIFTRDTHPETYLDTQEGKNLPVVHCISGSTGWQIREGLGEIRPCLVIDKPTFGSAELGAFLAQRNEEEPIGEITLIGLCTDICVISNALLIKAFLPEVPVRVDAACCAGVTPESHRNALEAMKMCQIRIDNA